MYKEIWDKLKIILDSIKTDQSIAYIYNHGVKQPDGFPYITIQPATTTENIYWSVSNLAIVPYDIDISVQATNDIDVQEAKIREVVDAVLLALRDDEYLTWTAQKAQYEVERAYQIDQEIIRNAKIKATYWLLIC